MATTTVDWILADLGVRWTQRPPTHLEERVSARRRRTLGSNLIAG
jgi:hypothetical protein